MSALQTRRVVGSLFLVLASSWSSAPSAYAKAGPSWSESSGFALSLRGAYQTFPFGEEWLADVRLVVNLDIFTSGASGRRLQAEAIARESVTQGDDETPRTDAEPESARSERKTAPGGRTEADAPEAERTSDSEAVGPERAAEPAAATPRFRLTSHMARSTVGAAVAALGISVTEKQLDDLLSRARLSALLPELRLRVGRNLDNSLRFAPTADDPTYYTTTGASDWRFEARVTWHLDRLVYVKEELAVQKLRRQDRELSLERAKRTLDALVDWQRGLSVESDPETEPEARLEARLDKLEAEVRLDVLTNGWFSRYLERHAPPPVKARKPGSWDRRPPPKPRGKRKKHLAESAARE